jgi:transmembrane sensor
MANSRRLPPLNEHTWTQASDWLLRFSEEEVDAVAREQFNDWLRRSPENVHAYLHVSAFWQAASHLGRNGEAPRDIDALVARAGSEANVLPLARLNPERSPQYDTERAAGRVDLPAKSLPPARTGTGARAKQSHWAIAASLLVAMAGLAAYSYLERGVYHTDIGERRIVNLPDGSTMTLNADSRVTVRYTDAARTIDLDEGQALFKVAKNAARPFVVKSGGTSVRAVGTQFDVYKKKSGTVVTVVEGRVAVSSSPFEVSGTVAVSDTASAHHKAADVLLSAGEQVMVAAVARRIDVATPAPPAIYPASIEVAMAWTEGLLVFEAAPLDEVVQEFNRQNAKPLVLEGGGLEAVKITGTFPANGSERIIRFLQGRHGVVVHETDDEIRISRR